MKFDIGKF